MTEDWKFKAYELEDAQDELLSELQLHSFAQVGLVEEPLSVEYARKIVLQTLVPYPGVLLWVEAVQRGIHVVTGTKYPYDLSPDKIHLLTQRVLVAALPVPEVEKEKLMGWLRTFGRSKKPLDSDGVELHAGDTVSPIGFPEERQEVLEFRNTPEGPEAHTRAHWGTSWVLTYKLTLLEE